MAREKPGKRETKVVAMLQFIFTNMWKALFGRKADGLEKSKEHEHTCAWRGMMWHGVRVVPVRPDFRRFSLHPSLPPRRTDMIRDNDPLTNRYISVPRDYSPLNCASYIGGIVRGALEAADFVCGCLLYCLPPPPVSHTSPSD